MQRKVRFAPTPRSSSDSLDSSCSCDSTSSCRLIRRQRKRQSAPVMSTAKVKLVLRSSSARLPERFGKRRGMPAPTLRDLCLNVLLSNVITFIFICFVVCLLQFNGKEYNLNLTKSGKRVLLFYKMCTNWNGSV